MERPTQVSNMKIKTRTRECMQAEAAITQPVELSSGGKIWRMRFFQADRLVRNLAVTGVLLLTVVAVRNSSLPQAQSVFGALKETAGMEWDESLGKLSFVSDFLPEGVREVWNEKPAMTVLAPMNGETVHAWSEREPYITIQSNVSDVRAAADGEVMSIAHGMNEERILRVRHDDGSEALYGNLLNCYVGEGDRVYAGDVIAALIRDQPLAFELRMDGRSVNPEGRLTWFQE